MVEKGNRLTIRDCYVRVNPDDGIIVRKGAVLVVNNAIIGVDLGDPDDWFKNNNVFNDITEFDYRGQ